MPSVEQRRRGELISFRISPTPWIGWDEFYRVRLFKTPLRLRLYARNRARPTFTSPDCLGLCTTWARRKRLDRGRIKLPLECGEILLVHGNLGSSVVAHEVTHAALAHARRNGWDLSYDRSTNWVGDGEENVCYAVGEMCKQVYQVLSDNGLLA